MVSKTTLLRVQDLFFEELENTLSHPSGSETEIHCSLTPMQDLPTGQEKGKLLALHYEGDFIQLIYMNMLGKRMYDMLIDVYPLSLSMLDATLTEVLAFAAECADDFITNKNLMKFLPMPMGVTVNLPVQYNGKKVFLAKTTEQFSYPQSLEIDMVENLGDALDRLGLDIDIVSFLNNGSATLLANYWKNPSCKVALQTGNGSHLCYMEETMDKIRASGIPRDSKCVFVEIDNGEFGLKGELSFFKSEVDIELEGLNPNEQVFERMVSGRFLGELVRLKINQLISENLMLRGIGSARLSTPNNFRKEYVILVENDDTSFEQTQKVAEELDLGHATKTDLAIIKYVCKLFLTRSARLVAAATAALITKLEVPEIAICIEGTLLHFNPFYEYKIQNALEFLVGTDVKIQYMSSENGPAKGAAIAAALSFPKENEDHV